MYEADTVKRIGMIFIQCNHDNIEIMITDYKRVLVEKLYENSSETFFVTFGELLSQMYKAKCTTLEKEINDVKERIEQFKAKGWRTDSEESKLKLLEEEVARYITKYSLLNYFIDEFKKVCQ
jgi:Tfp pilus assembly pilus retraction ATPase PilT